MTIHGTGDGYTTLPQSFALWLVALPDFARWDLLNLLSQAQEPNTTEELEALRRAIMPQGWDGSVLVAGLPPAQPVVGWLVNSNGHEALVPAGSVSIPATGRPVRYSFGESPASAQDAALRWMQEVNERAADLLRRKAGRGPST